MRRLLAAVEQKLCIGRDEVVDTFGGLPQTCLWWSGFVLTLRQVLGIFTRGFALFFHHEQQLDNFFVCAFCTQSTEPITTITI